MVRAWSCVLYGIQSQEKQLKGHEAPSGLLINLKDRLNSKDRLYLLHVARQRCIRPSFQLITHILITKRIKIFNLSQCNVSINSMGAPPSPEHLSGIVNCTCSQGRAFAFCKLALGWGICLRPKSQISVACFAIIMAKRVRSLLLTTESILNTNILMRQSLHSIF